MVERGSVGLVNVQIAYLVAQVDKYSDVFDDLAVDGEEAQRTKRAYFAALAIEI